MIDFLSVVTDVVTDIVTDVAMDVVMDVVMDVFVRPTKVYSVLGFKAY